MVGFAPPIKLGKIHKIRKNSPPDLPTSLQFGLRIWKNTQHSEKYSTQIQNKTRKNTPKNSEKYSPKNRISEAKSLFPAMLTRRPHALQPRLRLHVPTEQSHGTERMPPLPPSNDSLRTSHQKGCWSVLTHQTPKPGHMEGGNQFIPLEDNRRHLHEQTQYHLRLVILSRLPASLSFSFNFLFQSHLKHRGLP